MDKTTKQEFIEMLKEARGTKPLNRHTSSKFPITYSLGRINQRMPNGKQFEFRQRSEAETADSEVTQ
jgi:hypothetical protein